MINAISAIALAIVFIVLFVVAPAATGGGIVMAVGFICIGIGLAGGSGGVSGIASWKEQLFAALVILTGFAAVYIGGRTLGTNSVEWLL